MKDQQLKRMLSAFGVGIVALVMSAYATHAATLTITENSSTSLSAILNGGTGPQPVVSNIIPDKLTVILPFSLVPANFGFNISEPPSGAGSSGSGFNTVIPSTIPGVVTTELIVQSDLSTPGGASLADGLPGFLGTVSGNVSETVALIFHDAGDSGQTTVPDQGSTICLLLLSLAAVFGATRLRVATAR